MRSSGAALARPYTVYFGPDGERADSRPAAWRMHDMATQDQRSRAVVSDGATGSSTPSQERGDHAVASGSVSPTRHPTSAFQEFGAPKVHCLSVHVLYHCAEIFGALVTLDMILHCIPIRYHNSKKESST